MVSMVEAMGGLQELDKPLQELILLGDAYIAAEMKTKPQWTDADLDNSDENHATAHGLQELQKLLSGDVPFASGLLTSMQQEIVPSTLRWIVLDLAVILSVLRSTSSPTSTAQSRSADSLHWVHRRGIAIRHRLLNLELGDLRSDAVRTAMVLWMFMCFSVAGKRRSVKVIAPFLKETLVEIEEYEWHGHKDVRCWVLIIGALSATTGSPDYFWFVGQLNILACTRARSADGILASMISLCDRFFYLESAQQTSMTILAEGLYQLRSKQKLSLGPKSSNSPE
jgi:hypothetical protein